MMRFSLLLGAAVLTTAGAAGCTQCDTCDDFPVPCVGGNCGGPAAVAAPVSYPGTYTGGGPMIVPPAPPMSAASPFGASAPVSELAPASVTEAPRAPRVPAPSTPAAGDPGASNPPVPRSPAGAPGPGR